MADSKSKEMVKAAIEAMKDKKAEDIRVIDISNVSVIADYFIIANGNNPNQVQAIVDNVEEQLYKAGFADPKVEGYNSASWILLDYEDVIIHVFSKEDRLFYNLERIWRGSARHIGRSHHEYRRPRPLCKEAERSRPENPRQPGRMQHAGSA